MIFPTWARYFFKEYLRSLVFILAIVYALYVLIDTMSHLKNFTEGKGGITVWIEYYFYTLSKRFDVLLPFALLLATIRCLCNFQQRGELVALLASGIALRTLLRPFLCVAIGCTLLLYMNYEWFLPSALPKIEAFTESSFGKSKTDKEKPAPKEIMLQDGSKIIYTQYNPKTKEFNDLFWVRSTDCIFHIKTLTLTSSSPIGTWVDTIERNKDNILEKKASFESFEFKDMHFDEHSLKNSIIPPKEQSLSQLFVEFPLYFSSFSHKAGEIKASLYSKISFPWLCLIALMAPAPFCLRFTRNHPLLIIYLASLALLFCLNVLFESSSAFAKSQVISPAITIFVPWIVTLFFFTKRYRAI